MHHDIYSLFYHYLSFCSKASYKNNLQVAVQKYKDFSAIEIFHCLHHLPPKSGAKHEPDA